MSKIFISATLDNNQKYFPGILPFYFKLYNHEINGNEIVSSIEKKSHFSKKTETIKNKISDAVDYAKKAANKQDLICITGSLFTVGEVKDHIKKYS